MKSHQPREHEKLVRTTVRLPQQTFKRLKRLSLEEEEPVQRILDRAIEQYERRAAKRAIENIFKYKVKPKKGVKFPPSRAELYDEILKHRVRTDR